MDILIRIKQLVLRRDVYFTAKARLEMRMDGIDEEDVLAPIVNARRVEKVISSRDPATSRREKLYVIKAPDFHNLLICTKGKIVKDFKAKCCML